MQDYRVLRSRSTSRLNSRVPVALEWPENGQAVRVEGRTVDVSPKGCLALFPQELAVGQRLRLRNLVNHQEVEGVLVWKGQREHGGWEVGIELIQPPQNFWDWSFDEGVTRPLASARSAHMAILPAAQNEVQRNCTFPLQRTGRHR